MTMNRRRLTVASAAVVWGSLSVALPAQVTAQSAPVTREVTLRSRGWTDVDTLRGIPSGYSLRWPSLAIGRDGFIVAANLFAIDADVTVGRTPLFVMQEAGGALRAPVGDFLFAYPKGIVDRAGLYHLFWADGPGPATPQSAWPGRVTSVWHADWNGREWSRAEELVRGERVDWGAEDGVVTMDANGVLYVAMPVWPADTAPHIAVFTRAAHTWRRHVAGGVAAYAAIAATGRDSLEMLVVHPDPDTPGDAGSLFSISSGDGGRTWHPGARVYAANGSPVLSPTLVVQRDRQLRRRHTRVRPHHQWTTRAHGTRYYRGGHDHRSDRPSHCDRRCPRACR